MNLIRIWRDFDRLTVEDRLRTITTGSIWALGIVGAIQAAAIGSQLYFSSRAARETAYAEASRTMQMQLLQARRREQDFLLRNDENDVLRHAEEMKVYDSAALMAAARTSSGAESDAITSLAPLAKNYQDAFAALAAARRDTGFDEFKGAQGRMGISAQRAESAVDDAHILPLQVALLQMRRTEKDYIRSHDSTYAEQFKADAAAFQSKLAAMSDRTLPAASRDSLSQLINGYELNFDIYESADGLALAAVAKARDSANAIEPKLNAESAAAQARAATLNLVADRVSYGATLLIVLSTAYLAWMLSKSLRRLSVGITRPIRQLAAAVKRLQEGDETSRARLDSPDEIGQFGAAFDQMVEARVVAQASLKHENEQLNESVVELLKAVAQLSRKDLTVKVPVTADITGPVADALNLLTVETSRVLQRVSDISADVSSASLTVKQQADTVMSAAQAEREQVEETATALEAASRSMQHIAAMAQQSKAAADKAISTTQQALETVTSTVGGINNTRDTIRETEKRIKRLGERSQEISVAVGLINTIAERTHILALNAAMHAASAGEAGRGFAVVADEVQRLAESARESTQQIATLVNNIQVETADTVNAMNAAISEVVGGAKLAEQAGRQMQATQASTSELVESVQKIAAQSQVQAQSTSELLHRADLIKKSTQETSRQLTEQTQQTNALVAYARSLLEAVRVFKLPSAA